LKGAEQHRNVGIRDIPTWRETAGQMSSSAQARYFYWVYQKRLASVFRNDIHQCCNTCQFRSQHTKKRFCAGYDDSRL